MAIDRIMKAAEELVLFRGSTRPLSVAQKSRRPEVPGVLQTSPRSEDDSARKTIRRERRFRQSAETPQAAIGIPKTPDLASVTPQSSPEGIAKGFPVRLDLGGRLRWCQSSTERELRGRDICPVQIGRNQVTKSTQFGETSHHQCLGRDNGNAQRTTARFSPTTRPIAWRLRSHEGITPLASDILPIHGQSQFPTAGPTIAQTRGQSVGGRIAMKPTARVRIERVPIPQKHKTPNENPAHDGVGPVQQCSVAVRNHGVH